jgi:hypothetical protein
LVLPKKKLVDESVTSSAVTKARTRLGSEPMAKLFERSAAMWSRESANRHRWRGLGLYGIDGTTLRVADTPDNAEQFGRPRNGAKSKSALAGYPQLRFVALMALRSHVLGGVRMGACTESELKVAEPLCNSIPDQSLTIADRLFFSYRFLSEIRSGGSDRHWLVRAKTDLKYKVVRRRGRNDWDVEFTLSKSTGRRYPELPKKMAARVIRYQRRGFQERTLVTSLLDSQRFPAREIAELYHERWELELGFDEMKTHTLEREESLRSRSSGRTLQEVWGLAIAFNIVRVHMEDLAAEAKVSPTRISFRATLLLLRDCCRTAVLLTDVAQGTGIDVVGAGVEVLVLPARRRRKSFPRAVKIKGSPYNRKRCA